MIAVDGNAVCHLSFDDEVDENSNWPCSILCKEWTEEQKKVLIQLKDCFEDSVDMLRPLLECLDEGRGQSHNSKCCCVESSDGNTVFIIKQLLGHPMHCASNACNSLLRLLCAGAVHYPALKHYFSYSIVQDGTVL